MPEFYKYQTRPATVKSNATKNRSILQQTALVELVIHCNKLSYLIILTVEKADVWNLEYHVILQEIMGIFK